MEKCLTCKSFVKLVLSVSVSLSLSLCLSVCLSLSVSVLCVSLCCVLCVVVVVVVEEGEEEENGRRTIWLLIPAKVCLKREENEQLHQVKRMIGGIGNMWFSICSQTENVYDLTVSLVDPLWGQLRTLRELFLLSKPGDDHPCVDSKTPPCVHSKTYPRVPAPRAHVYGTCVLTISSFVSGFLVVFFCFAT